MAFSLSVRESPHTPQKPCAALVQEFCNGGSLRSAISTGVFRTHHLPQRWRPIMSVLRDICEGMAYMHEKRICHGDLTPANVLLQVTLKLPSTDHRTDSKTLSIWGYFLDLTWQKLSDCGDPCSHPLPPPPDLCDTAFLCLFFCL